MNKFIVAAFVTFAASHAFAGEAPVLEGNYSAAVKQEFDYTKGNGEFRLDRMTTSSIKSADLSKGGVYSDNVDANDLRR